MGDRIGFGLYQFCRNSGTCVCVLVAVVWGGGVRSGWVAWARLLEGGVVLCQCVL